MPRLEVIERDWEKAIKIVKEAYKDVEVGSPRFWALVFGVVKRMRGRKSARHLRGEGILHKQLGNIEYLPFIFQQKVRGIDLWMDIPPHPTKVPPTAIPTIPAARSWFVDVIRKGCRRKGWTPEDLANEVVTLIIENPLLLSLDKSQLISLVSKGKVLLPSVEKVGDDEEVGWKLAWIYAMLAGKIQPVSPRWGYKLAQLTRDIKDTALRRIDEHFAEQGMSNIFGKYNSDFVVKDFRSGKGCGVLSPTIFLDKVMAMVEVQDEFYGRTGEEVWQAIMVSLMSLVPVWVAYALAAVDEIDLDEVKYLFPTSLEKEDFLFVITNDREILEYPNPQVEVIPLPATKEELKDEIKHHLKREGYAPLQELRDEIISTVSRKWI